MPSLWEILKASKGLPAPDGFTALFAHSLSDTYTLAEINGIPPLNLGEIVEIVDYTIYGNTYQAEGVSSDTPQDVVGVGDRTGNLAYGKIEAVNIGNGGIIVSTSVYDVAIAHIEIGEVYTANSFVLAFYTDEPVLGSVSYDGSRIVETMGQPTTFVAPITGYVAFRVNSGEQPMLNSGSTPLPYEPYGYKVDVECRGKNLFDILGTEATEYSPYVEPITTPIYLDSPLYKIGDYADSRGKTEEVRVVKELVLTGEENWQIYADGVKVHQFYTDLPTDKTSVSGLSAYSNIVGYGATANNRNEYEFGCYPVTSGTQIAFQMRGVKEQFANISAWKSYLAAQYSAGTPVTVYYVLAEPEIKTVSPVEIPTIQGTNIIDINTEVKPSNLKITYKSKM